MSTPWGKTRFLSWVQAKTIVCQIFIHLLLTTEHGGFQIEVHPDPGTMESSFPLSLHLGLSFARTANRTRLLTLLHRNKNEKGDRYQKTRGSEEGKKEDEDAETWGKMPNVLERRLLNPRGMNSQSFRALHILRWIDQNCHFRYAVPTLSTTSYKSDGNLIDLQLIECTFKALPACKAMHAITR